MIDLLLKLLARKRASVFPKMLNFSFKVKVMWKVVLFYWKKKSHFSALAQYFFKVFLNEYLINRSLLATIIIALAVNVAKAVKVPIILVVFGCVCVCVCMFCWEASSVIISAVRRWVYSGRLYEVCRDSFVTEPATVTEKKMSEV